MTTATAIQLSNEAHKGRTNFIGQDLSGVNFSGLHLKGANFRRANLQGANLQGANLQGANFTEALLCGADLRGANLHRADIWKADLRRTTGNGWEVVTLTIGDYCIVIERLADNLNDKYNEDNNRMWIADNCQTVSEWMSMSDAQIEFLDDQMPSIWGKLRPIIQGVLEIRPAQ